MSKVKFLSVALLLPMLLAGASLAGSVDMRISGPGAVNDSTIKAGETVSVDIYCANDTLRTGFTLGFQLMSGDIKSVVHVADKGNGLNDNGDIKGHNGWQDKSVWDFAGVMTVERSWDGTLPDTIGLGGLSIKKGYYSEKVSKKMSFNIMVPEAGTLVIDSAYFPPGGKWLFSSPPRVAPAESPMWGGPYKFKVVK